MAFTKSKSHFFYRYPSRYIDIQFRKFFVKHNLSISSLLSIIDTSDKFFALRNHLLNIFNTQQTKPKNNKIEVVIDAHHPTHITVKKVWKQTESLSQSRLIIHLPYENRLRSFRKDIHQLWSTCPPLSQITLPKLNHR